MTSHHSSIGILSSTLCFYQYENGKSVKLFIKNMNVIRHSYSNLIQFDLHIYSNWKIHPNVHYKMCISGSAALSGTIAMTNLV